MDRLPPARPHDLPTTVIRGDGSAWRRALMAGDRRWILGPAALLLLAIALPVHTDLPTVASRLPLLVVVFVLAGLTERPGVVLATVPAAVGALRWGSGGGGLPDGRLLYLATGVALGMVLATMLAGRRRATASVATVFTDTRRLTHARTVAEAVAAIEEAVMRHLGATAALVLVPAPPAAGGTAWTPAAQDGIDLPADLTDALRAHPIGDLAVPLPLTVGPAPALLVPLLLDGRAGAAVLVTWEPDAGPHGPHGRRRRGEGSPRFAFPLPVGLDVYLTEAAHRLTGLRRSARIGGQPASDPVTGLANRRTVEARLARLAPGDAVVILGLDADRGQGRARPATDPAATLRAFVSCLTEACRTDDWCGRLDGEQFVLVLSGAGDDAVAAVHSIRSRWRAARPTRSFCAGVAVHGDDHSPFQTLTGAETAHDLARVHGPDRIERAQGSGIAVLGTPAFGADRSHP